MSDANPDILMAARSYRDRLKAELAEVEEFLAMADRLSRFREDGPNLFLTSDADDETEQAGARVQPLNVLREG